MDEDGVEYEHILTIIDIGSIWVELIPLRNTSGVNVARQFDKEWINRYPRPKCVLTDQGKNLVGREINELMESYGIKHKYTTAYNPQTNGICERMHYTLNEILRCIGEEDWVSKLDGIAFALRANYHTALEKSPSEAIFGMKMILPYVNKQILEWTKSRTAQRMRDVEKENKNRIDYNYKIGELVLKKNSRKAGKFDREWLGPYAISLVNGNTITIVREGGLEENVNIRKICRFIVEGQDVVIYKDDYNIDDGNGVSNDDNGVMDDDILYNSENSRMMGQGTIRRGS